MDLSLALFDLGCLFKDRITGNTLIVPYAVVSKIIADTFWLPNHKCMTLLFSGIWRNFIIPVRGQFAQSLWLFVKGFAWNIVFPMIKKYIISLRTFKWKFDSKLTSNLFLFQLFESIYDNFSFDDNYIKDLLPIPMLSEMYIRWLSLLASACLDTG